MDVSYQVKHIFPYIQMLEGELKYLDNFSKNFTMQNLKDSLNKIRTINDSIREDLDLIEDRVQAEIRVIEELNPKEEVGITNIKIGHPIPTPLPTKVTFYTKCAFCGDAPCSKASAYCPLNLAFNNYTV
jgi:hypothetical protein